MTYLDTLDAATQATRRAEGPHDPAVWIASGVIAASWIALADADPIWDDIGLDLLTALRTIAEPLPPELGWPAPPDQDTPELRAGIAGLLDALAAAWRSGAGDRTRPDDQRWKYASAAALIDTAAQRLR